MVALRAFIPQQIIRLHIARENLANLCRLSFSSLNTQLVRPITVQVRSLQMSMRLVILNNPDFTHLTALFLLAVLSLTPGSSIAGPFGLEQGMTLSDLGNATESIVPGKYRLDTVPNPNPAFEEYIVQVGSNSGLCWIKAISADIDTNPYGAELKADFNTMKGIVEDIYGLHKVIDGVILGSEWNAASDWMKALLHEERLLAAFWDRHSGSTLPGNLIAIDLVASPSTHNSGYIAIEYSFSNIANCEFHAVVSAETNVP